MKKSIKLDDIKTNGRIDFEKINKIDPFMFAVPPRFKQVKTIPKQTAELIIGVCKNEKKK